jgi:FkbM family methyltransferase
MNNFHEQILNILTKSINNHHDNNFDFELVSMPLKTKVKLFFEGFFSKISQKYKPDTVVSILDVNYYWKNLNKFEGSYNLLCDEESRVRYIEILAYKMLGFSKVKLSLNSDKFWSQRQAVDKLKVGIKIPVNFRTKYLELYNLKPLGHNLKIFFIKNGILTDFILQQYNYNEIVKVEKGDVVMDCGGCWGDTAMYFASLGAESVYSFEFIPSNIGIFEKNINMNPQYKNVVNIVNSPVFDKDGVEMSYLDRGPASIVAGVDKYDCKTVTVSIDGIVDKNNLKKVDFIKMDIEGAEIHALTGAKNTIKKFKPKLAISVYHKSDDLITIPKLINSIRDDYKFYFDYYTIISNEAIIYAV